MYIHTGIHTSYYSLVGESKPEYNSLLTDLKSVGWQVNDNTVEIGSIGHFTQDTLDAVIRSFTLCVLYMYVYNIIHQ